MNMTANILTGLVALLHIYFLILEMFLWDKPFGLKTFGHTHDAAKNTKILAMNQGLYNGFLAAGLLWGLSLGSAGENIIIFFLSCVIVAGVFAGLTANRKIIVIQALPALLALTFLLLQKVS